VPILGTDKDVDPVVQISRVSSAIYWHLLEMNEKDYAPLMQRTRVGAPDPMLQRLSDQVCNLRDTSERIS
jgi:hypothetical protein